MNIPKKRSRTFVRPRLQEVYFPFDIHSSIPKSDVSEVYNPVGDDINHPKPHRQSKVAGTNYWFNSPDCAQILADAVSAPICVYPSPSFESEWNPAMTFLPLELPIKQSNKLSHFHLQNIDQIHWAL
ncbi:hypothetical protein BD560DRAFT_427433 [Blakeslea trispora]|nr:hypothetical protein BD560DRAFT_427433 [Blakeslea trispora]